MREMVLVPMTVCVHACECVGAYFDHNVHANLKSWMLYIVTSLVHTCHSYVRGFCFVFFMQQRSVFFQDSFKKRKFHNFVMPLCILWGNVETQGSKCKRHRQWRQRQWFTVVLLLLCIGSNKPVLQRGALFKFSLLPNKGSSHSLITGL